jgi:hypothetical protein
MFCCTLEPSNAIWHLDREDARNHYASWSIANTMWSGLTAGWFALSTFVFVATTLRRFPDVAGPRYPLFSGPLSAARQPLRIVFDLATGLKAAVVHARTYYLSTLLGMIDQSTGFLTNPSFDAQSIIVLVGTETERKKIKGMIAQLETKEQRVRVRVAMRGEWYTEEGIEVAQT